MATMRVDEDSMLGGKSLSSPTLPPVAGATLGRERGKDAQKTRQMRRRPVEAPRRQAFLKGLLNEDLQQLAQWHGSRPSHEQRRFLRSVDTLYKSFVNEPDHGKTQFAKTQAQSAAKVAAQAAAKEAAAQKLADEDPLRGPPRSPRAMHMSATMPDLSADMLDHRRRIGRDVEEYNSLDNWLEAGSVTTATTGTTAATRLTSFTQKTKTSSGGPSICSEPGTMNQLHYRHHKRGIALNRWEWKASDPFAPANLKDGVPNFGFPDQERLQTSFGDAFGSRPVGENITKAMYESVFTGGAQQFVDGYLAQAPPEKRQQMMQMVRSLEYLRTARDREKVSVQREEMNLKENSRLFKPSRQKPWFDTSEVNKSQIPLGTLTQGKMDEDDRPPLPTPPPARPRAPPSPSVSNLGSMPLSRMSTPAM
eukprot:TRINITY_DN111624_c0_g1_i1.p1 TRINITY_DN111624_c0_g1~~TRINITY_DN111624_c0_g1_i1.p1  ORF type:complete len:421 (+),score=110.34 TRINITY_DN111624_c0_g1_i1:86-1348(+)